MADDFVIFCPWCKQPSDFRHELPRLMISMNNPREDLNKALDGEEGRPRVLTCKNPDCWAPFEAVLCYDVETARTLQSIVQERSWSTPMYFFLRSNREGVTYPHVCTTFNTKPVKRWSRVVITDLMDRELVEKAIQGFSVARGVPLTAFEAFDTEDHLFWIPIEPQGDAALGLPYRTPVCDYFRKQCRRRAEKELQSLASVGRLGEHCRYWRICTMRSCMGQDGPAVEHCLQRLLLWEKYDLCYRSDLEIIDKLVKNFESSQSDPVPVTKECWAGMTEIAYPIIAQNHLVAVMMTGRFRTAGKPRAEDLLQAAQEKRRQCNMKGFSFEAPQELSDAIDQADDCSETKKTLQQIGELASPNSSLQQSANYLAETAQNRIDQQRDRVEHAFRDELAGKLGLSLYGGRDISKVLPEVQKRMMEFWAFKRCCILVGAQQENSLELFAVDGRNVRKKPKVMVELPGHRSGVFLILPQEVRKQRAFHHLRKHEAIYDFVKNLGEQLVGLGLNQLNEEDLILLVLVSRHDRRHLFCFNHREHGNLFRLPFRPTFPRQRGRSLRLSDECRSQIRVACQMMADQLHHFWYAYEREQSTRAFAHTLRNTVVHAKNFCDLLSEQFGQRGTEIRQWSPELHEAIGEALTGLKIGRDLLRDELNKFRITSDIEEFIADAGRGTTDLTRILREVRYLYDHIAVLSGKTWEVARRFPQDARVRGRREAIELAIRNVAENAYKYSYKDRKPQVDLAYEEGEWILSFTSQGVPIDADELGLIILKGYRGRWVMSKRRISQTGTGLGMYLVKRIVDGVGGELNIKSERFRSTDQEGITTVELRFQAWAPDQWVEPTYGQDE